MPFDALCLTGVLQELRPVVEGLRIEKVQQPARSQVVLTLRGSRRLLLCAEANEARIHFTKTARENPAAPPMFCMLLRKHLGGGKIVSISQPSLERAVCLTVDAVDEMGVPTTRKLILECMGTRSNLILLDEEDRIIECLRRVDLEMNQDRQILPGLYYHLPTPQAKLDPVTVDEAGFQEILDRAPAEAEASSLLLDSFFGLSPLVCREIAFQGCGSHDARLLSPEIKHRLKQAFFTWQDRVRRGVFSPCLLEKNGRPKDYSYLPIAQYGEAMEAQRWDSFSPMLDAFYETREQQERVRQRGQDLIRTATNARDRTRRKLALQEKEYAATQDRDTLRLYGELITANLYRAERGARTLSCENYYDPDCPPVEIPLDPLLTPQENAAKYFKRYRKAQAAEAHLTEQMAIARRERDWLESVLDEISRAESEQDFLEIRRELRDGGYMKGAPQGKKEMRRGKSQPRVFRSSSGLKILVGRSNTQNDQLTKGAFKSDYWFHTQKIHGSHVILCAEGLEPDEVSMQEAASLAAWFSQGQDSGRVAVDYTKVKYVKKPAGAKPGMVIYEHYQTVNVVPNGDLVKQLAEK